MTSLNQVQSHGNRTPGLDYASANFSRRNRNGILDGSLTTGEQGRVAEARADYNNSLAEAKSDGTVTRDERQELRGDRRQVSHLIYNLRHNQLGNMASYRGGFQPEDWAQVPKGPNGGGFPGVTQPPVSLPYPGQTPPVSSQPTPWFPPVSSQPAPWNPPVCTLPTPSDTPTLINQSFTQVSSYRAPWMAALA